MIQKNPRTLVVSALVAVYFIWGSTYLALRFGLEGFPPFILNGVRFVIAGAVMYAVLRMRGAKPPTRRQWWNAGRMGALLLIGGVGLMTIAEDLGVGSGVAATAAWLGLGVGLVGVIVLLQEGDFAASTPGMLLVIAGPLLWAFGSVWGKRLEMPEGFMAPATQLLTAGVVMLVAGPLMGERIVEMPGTVAWVALAYLIVMGSIVALTLGAEIISGPIFIALPLILVGVGLTATTYRRPKRAISLSIPGPPVPLEEAA